MYKKLKIGIIGILIILGVILFVQNLLRPTIIQDANLEDFIDLDTRKTSLTSIRVNGENEIFINELKTDPSKVVSTLDSLNSIGFENSKVVLDIALKANLGIKISLMENIQKSNREIIVINN